MSAESAKKVIDAAEMFDPWPTPEPLVADHEAPAEYPGDALPPIIGDAVRSYQAYGQQPLALVACSALGAVSLSVQALTDVERGKYLSGPISLNIAVVAGSGERKTSCDRRFGMAIRKWLTARRDEMQPDVDIARAKVAAHTAKRDGILAKIKGASGKKAKSEAGEVASLQHDLEILERDAPREPIVPRLFYEDVSPEALAERMAFGWPSASLWSDEAGLVVGGRGMGDDSLMRYLALLNRFWDGLPFERDRTVAKSFIVRGRRFSSSLMMQPTVMSKLLSSGDGTSRGTGFLARFLVAWPESTMGTRMYREPTGSAELDRFDNRIAELLNLPLPTEGPDMVLTPPVLPLDYPATRVWREFHDDVERQLGKIGDYATVCDFAAKTADNAARLAACFHVMEHGPSGAIGADTMQRGAQIAAWHLHEAKRLMGNAEIPEALADARGLLDWLNAKGGKVALKMVLNSGPSALREKARRDRAVERLVDTGNALVRKIDNTATLVINPKISGVK